MSEIKITNISTRDFSIDFAKTFLYIGNAAWWSAWCQQREDKVLFTKQELARQLNTWNLLFTKQVGIPKRYEIDSFVAKTARKIVPKAKPNISNNFLPIKPYVLEKHNNENLSSLILEIFPRAEGVIFINYNPELGFLVIYNE